MGWRHWETVVLAVAVFALTGCPSDKVKPVDNEGNGSTVWSHPSGNPNQVNTKPPGQKEASCPAYCSPDPAVALNRTAQKNPIPEENQKQGDWNWRAGTPANNREIELYADKESLFAGEPVHVKVSTSVAKKFSATVYRIGWYNGTGARPVWTGGPYDAEKQSACDFDPDTALVECDWKDTFTIPTDSSWITGFYVIKVLRDDGFKRFYPFVIRDTRAAEILYTPNFTTYQAYNTWGGESLYFDGSGTMPTGKGWQVSFNRPYEATDGGGKTFNLDIWFIQFLEKHGYDVTYGSQLDFLRFKNMLEGIGAFVDAGQDEYWPVQERDQVDAALQTGNMSLAYFGGNGGYWRVRLLTDEHGNSLRTMLCYKDVPQKDPQPNSTIRFRDSPDARPEQNLWGTMYEGWQLIPFPLIVSDPSNWIFEGTGLVKGTQLHGLVGFEYDRSFPDWQNFPSGIANPMTSPVVSGEGIPSYAQTAVRTLPNGRLVFAAGTIWWPLALGDDPELYDDRVERITLNVIERALSHRRAPKTLPTPAGSHPTNPPPNAVWAKTVAAFAGVNGQAGYVDGPSAQAKFNAPTGLATRPAGELVVADTGNNRIRIVGVDPQRTVSTVAGNGDLGYRDGEGSQAMFRAPNDVAVGPSGEIYVADSGNHAIRRIDKTANGWNVTTIAGQGFSAGYADGPPSVSRFNMPVSLAVDAAGNVYVADQSNNLIRMIKAGSHETVTIAGGGFGSDDASVGTKATFNSPSAIAISKTGVLYVVDGGNQLIRRIQTTGSHAVDTVAGNRNAWFGFADGAGDVARFRAQMGIDVGPTGEVMVADTANYRIRKIIVGANAAASQVYTIAGSGKFGSDLGSGEQADLVAPSGLTYGTNEKIYVTDPFHHVIREITR